MYRMAALALVWAVGLVSYDAMAMCGGGGMSGGAGRAGAGMTASGGGGSGAKQEKKENFKKWELPAASDVAALDTSAFDAAVSSLSLSEEQVKKIAEAKTKIGEEAQQLSKAQSGARTAYQSSACEMGCRSAATTVASAAEACKSFSPKQKFDAALAGILTRDQLATLRQLAKS